MLTVPALEGRENVLVGAENGSLVLIHYMSNETIFNLQGRTYLDGQLVGMIPWEHYHGSDFGVVVATRDPDALHFIGVSPTSPYFDFQQTVLLPEDPGAMAFGGGASGTELELGVTLPGVDQIAFISVQEGQWSLKQVLSGGDRPVDVLGIDVDGDHVLELVCADNGALSQSLSIFQQQSSGTWEIRNHQSLAGNPWRLQAWDLDEDGQNEIVVGYSDIPEVVFLDVQDEQYNLLGTVPLMATALEFMLERTDSGLTDLFVAHGESGLVDYFRGREFPFANIESYYPGCLPRSLSLCDFDGDGRKDLAAIALVNQTVTVTFQKENTDFWAYPALPLTTVPSGGVLGDFNGDGFTDLVVGGQNEKVLDFFAGTSGGAFNQHRVTQDLPHFLNFPTAIEVDDDGHKELAAIDPGFGVIRIMNFVPGSGFVELSQINQDFGTTGLVVADCDGDAIDDLVVVSPYQNCIKIYYGLLEGLFTEPVSVFMGGEVKSVSVLDLTGDDLLDLVVADGLSKVWTAINSGDRNFELSGWVLAGSGALHMAQGDFDGDLDWDIVVGNTADESLSFLENMGDGTLVARIENHQLPSKPLGLECDDMNQDGIWDVVVNLGDEGQVGIVTGADPWDFNYPFIINAAVNITQLMVGDFNDDLVPDILILDGSLNLGMLLLNIERELVPVHPSALTVQCYEHGLEIDVALQASESWSLFVGRPGFWELVAHDGQQDWGTCVFDRGRWRIDLSGDQLQELEANAGPLGNLALRLVVGEPSEEEELLVSLAGKCQRDESNLPSFVPAWNQPPYPNPFNPSLQAKFTLVRTGHVQASILDARGRQVATLLDGVREAGTHSLYWDGSNSAGAAGAGLYILRVATEYGILTQKVLLLK